MSAPRIWLTRPLADSERMADAVRARGMEPLVAPLMEIRRCALQIPMSTTPSALLLTSRHAAYVLPTLPPDWRQLPVYCVGKATAIAAQKNGFQRAIQGKGSAMGLVQPILVTQKRGDVILHLSGEEVRLNLSPILASYGIGIKRSIVYTAPAVHTLDSLVRDALEQRSLHGAVFYSPRSARVAHGLLQAAGCLPAMARVDGYCLSLDIAAAAGPLGCRTLHACPVPTHQAMMELLSTHAIAQP